MMQIDRRRLLGAGSSLLALRGPGAWSDGGGLTGIDDPHAGYASGMPAEGVKIDFSVLDGEVYRLIKTVHTNADGRNAEPLLTEENMKVGQYQLVFYTAEYFTKLGTILPNPPFLEKRRHPVRHCRCRRRTITFRCSPRPGASRHIAAADSIRPPCAATKSIHRENP